VFLRKYWLTAILFILLTSCNAKSNNKEQVNISPSKPQKSEFVQVSESSELIESEANKASNKDAAEAFYQELMAEYGQNCYECVEDVTVKIDNNSLPEREEIEKK